MKKISRRIVGIGAVATAAAALPLVMPVAATDKVKSDQVSVQISTLCSFSSATIDKEFVGTGTNGREVTFDDDGVHNFKVLCNNYTGYAVQAYATDLNGVGAVDGEALAYVLPANYATSGTTGNWTAVLTSANADAYIGKDEANATVIKSSNTMSADTGDDFSVQYKAYVGQATRAGTYSGEVKYTLTMNDPLPTIEANALQSESTVMACKALTGGATMEGIDTRDGKSYVIGKLADGNCWMLQDLDLVLKIDPENAGRMGTMKGDKFVAFTDKNTDLGNNNNGREEWVVSGSNVAYETQTSTGTTWDSYGRAGGASDTYEVRSFENGNKCMKKYNATGAGSDADATECADAEGSANSQRIGNYYNWPAATAGTGTYAFGSQYQNVDDSICPSGWHLPSGPQGTGASNAGEIERMLNAEIPAITLQAGDNTRTTMSADIMSKLTGYTASASGASLNILRSGYYYYNNAAVDDRGSNGYLWSRTIRAGNGAYDLAFYASYVYPGTSNNNKGVGFAVRCVAD